MRSLLATAVGLAFTLAMAGFSGEHDHHHKKGEGHAHSSPHGGVVTTIGDHHAEFGVDRDGNAHLHVLGADEKVAQPIDAKEITAQVKVHGQEDYKPLTLKPHPLKGEKAGTSSHFMGTADFLKGAKAYQAIVQINVGGKSHRAKFEGAAVKHDDRHHHEKKHDH